MPIIAAPETGAVLLLPIQGMTCASCVARVEKVIGQVPGVAEVAVNLASERASIRFAGEPDTTAVVAAVRRAGYEIAPTEFDLRIEGMTSHVWMALATTMKTPRMCLTRMAIDHWVLVETKLS